MQPSVRICAGGGIAVAGEIKAEEEFVAVSEDHRADQGDGDADQELKTEGVADAVFVTGAVELGGEDAGTGGGTENAKIKHENQIVHDGNAAHGNGADLTHHDVIQHIYEIRDAVLNDHRDGNS